MESLLNPLHPCASHHTQLATRPVKPKHACSVHYYNHGPPGGTTCKHTYAELGRDDREPFEPAPLVVGETTGGASVCGAGPFPP